MKRFLLLLATMLFSITYMCAATATLNLNVNAKTNFVPSTTLVAKTLVCTTSTFDDGATSKTFQSTASATDYTVAVNGAKDILVLVANALLGTVQVEYTCYLTTALEDNSYVFSHWTDNEGQVINGLGQTGEYKFSYTIDMDDLFTTDYDVTKGKWYNPKEIKIKYSPKNKVSKTINVTAHWVQPQVTGVDKETHVLEPITNPNEESHTEKLTFVVANAKAKNNFTCTLSGAGFYIKEENWNASTPNSYEVLIGYRPFGVHKLKYTGSVTLTSKYPSTNATSKTIKLQIDENYAPAFTVQDKYELSTKDNPTFIGASTMVAEEDIVPTEMNYAAQNGVWEWQELVDESGFFSLDKTNNSVTFRPVGEVDPTKPYTATLKIRCTYKDKASKLLYISKDVTLSAYAKVDPNARLEIGSRDPYDLEMSVIYGKPQKKVVSYVAVNLSEEPKEEWTTSSSEITYANNGSQITITASDKIPLGDYTASLKYECKTLGKSATLRIDAKVRMEVPELTAHGGLSQVTLNWNPVFGADKYIIKNETTTIVELSSTDVSYVVKNLPNGASVTYTVTAVYSADQQYNTTSVPVTVTPNMPQTITINDVPYLGLYTGTEKTGSFPYREKRLIDLSATFDASGNVLFNQLFLFGMTNGDASGNVTKPTATTNSNAVTPCYIYAKQDNKTYQLTKTIDNMNVITKPTEFNITANGQKIYLTGYVPYASCGTTWEENGVFYFTGNGTAVDLYLDNLELYARSKAKNGEGINAIPFKTFNANSTEEAVNLLGDPDIDLKLSPMSVIAYARGSGAAFAFTSTGNTPFKPTIHLRGYNVLESTGGCNIHIIAKGLIGQDFSAQQQSSPIQIQVTKDGHKNARATHLTLDDRWVGSDVRTNGYLNLANRTVRLAPTIDLGDEYSLLTFDGGQYVLSNAAIGPTTDALYTVSYAISYRMKSMYNGLAIMYGLGDDQPGGKVRFTNGSFTCAELPETHFVESLYHNRFSMKCPLDTKIDGGTFNSDVLACATTTSKGASPTNSAGDALCKVPIPVTATTANGVAILPSNWMTLAVQNGAKTSDLGYYGIHSMKPETVYEEDGTLLYGQGVNLLLPSDQVCFMEVVRTPWALCSPLVSTMMYGNEYQMGGSVEVPYAYPEEVGEELLRVQLTSRLLYVEMDKYVAEANDTYESPAGATMNIGNNGVNEYIENEDKYAITDKIYWIRPLVANEWTVVVPPFDVANVYVVEAYPEARLLADFGNGKTITGDKIFEARIAQSKRMLDFLFYWFYDVARQYNNDLWPKGNTPGYGSFVQEWISYLTKTDDSDPSNDKPAYSPQIQQLYHFTGTNFDANYYLYHSSGEWEYSSEEGFVTDWNVVQVQSIPRGMAPPQTIMHKGGIYCMSFPYTVGAHDPENSWDYWTGKYIIMEGYPTEHINDVIGEGQVLSGSITNWNDEPLSSAILADYEEDGASIRGNFTFGQLKVQKSNGFYLKKNEFKPSAAATNINPGEGFLLANMPSTPGMPSRRIASVDVKSGVVTYEEGEDNLTTSVTTPTIAGDRTIVVYTMPNGLGVIPIVPQKVSIYNAAGQLVTSQYVTEETQFDLPSGIYFVCGETDRVKAMVK